MDTLFGILDESSQRYGLKVFDSLVSQLSKWPSRVADFFVCVCILSFSSRQEPSDSV